MKPSITAVAFLVLTGGLAGCATQGRPPPAISLDESGAACATEVGRGQSLGGPQDELTLLCVNPIAQGFAPIGGRPGSRAHMAKRAIKNELGGRNNAEYACAHMLLTLPHTEFVHSASAKRYAACNRAT
jgi:hypothetical protein